MNQEKQIKKQKILFLIIKITIFILFAFTFMYIAETISFKRNSTNSNNLNNNDYKGSNNYVVKDTIKKQNGITTGYVACKIYEDLYEKYKNEVCKNNATIYHTISNNIDSQTFDEIYYLNDDYVVAISEENYKRYTNILNIDTGKVEKKLDYVNGVRIKKIENKNYYIADNSMGDSVFAFLNDNFEPLIKDYKNYAYDINSDNTLIIIPYQKNENGNTYPTKFVIYDFNGKKIFESKSYSEVIEVGKDFVIVNDNGNINVLDKNENVLKTIISLNGIWHSSQTDGGRNCSEEGRCEPIHLVKNDNSENNHLIVYNWKNNTFKLDEGY